VINEEYAFINFGMDIKLHQIDALMWWIYNESQINPFNIAKEYWVISIHIDLKSTN